MCKLEPEIIIKFFNVVFDLLIKSFCRIPVNLCQLKIQHDLYATYFVNLVTDGAFINDGNFHVGLCLWQEIWGPDDIGELDNAVTVIFANPEARRLIGEYALKGEYLELTENIGETDELGICHKKIYLKPF